MTTAVGMILALVGAYVAYENSTDSLVSEDVDAPESRGGMAAFSSIIFDSSTLYVSFGSVFEEVLDPSDTTVALQLNASVSDPDLYGSFVGVLIVLWGDARLKDVSSGSSVTQNAALGSAGATALGCSEASSITSGPVQLIQLRALIDEFGNMNPRVTGERLKAPTVTKGSDTLVYLPEVYTDLPLQQIAAPQAISPARCSTVDVVDQQRSTFYTASGSPRLAVNSGDLTPLERVQYASPSRVSDDQLSWSEEGFTASVRASYVVGDAGRSGEITRTLFIAGALAGVAGGFLIEFLRALSLLLVERWMRPRAVASRARGGAGAGSTKPR